MVRQNVSVLLTAKRLLKQFFVDAYCKIETEWLKFLRLEQTTSRADCYQDLHDVILDSDGDPRNVGRRLILPSTFTGGLDTCMSVSRMPYLMLGNMGILICSSPPQQTPNGQKLKIVCYLVRILRIAQT